MKSQSRSFIVSCAAKHNPRPKPTLAVLLLLFAAWPVFAEWVGDARPMMGTEVSVYLYAETAATGNDHIAAVFDEAARIDRLMSTYKDGSEISKINREAASRPLVISGELFDLLEKALKVSVITAGAFDITYDSVGQHYDFRQRQRPDDATIEAEIANIDYRNVSLDFESQSISFARQGVRINLGGIAKGYVVERCIALLKARGVQNAIVTAGGDSLILGDRRGRPWIIGIRDPRNEGEITISLPLIDEAVSTSGDYERFFDEDGVRYHHILKPSTGTPASGVHSATVIGPDAVMTDALSTSVFVMGVEKGLGLVSTLPDYESVVIDADGRVYYSDGLTPPDR